MDFIWPPRLCCEIHHYSRCFAHPRCKTRSISDQIAKVQRLTANAKRPVFGNVKNADTFAPLSPSCFVADNLSSPLRRGRFWVQSKICSLVAQIGMIAIERGRFAFRRSHRWRWRQIESRRAVSSAMTVTQKPGEPGFLLGSAITGGRLLGFRSLRRARFHAAVESARECGRRCSA